MRSNNPYQQYKEVQATTASPDRLLIMLYEGAIRFCTQAKMAMENDDVQKAHENLTRAQDIVLEFMATLDLKAGELTGNIMRIYEYINYCLIQANVTKDPQFVEEALAFLRDFRDTWEEAAERAKKMARGEAVEPVDGEEMANSLSEGMAPDGR